VAIDVFDIQIVINFVRLVVSSSFLFMGRIIAEQRLHLDAYVV
jgi:hypothetical protein